MSMTQESPVIESESCTGGGQRNIRRSTDARSVTSVSIEPELLLERLLTLEIVRVAERAAVAAARLRGHGTPDRDPAPRAREVRVWIGRQ